MKRLLGLAAPILILAGDAGMASDVAIKPPEDLAIFVLMGQSNMSGRGNPRELPARFPRNGSRLWLFNNAWTWQRAIEPLDSSEGQLDPVSEDRGAGVGPGLAFADVVAAHKHSENIALVPCAKGGSSIDQWAPNAGRDTLYGSCLERIREAQRFGKVRGILWYQGESDAYSVEAATSWPKKFTRIMQTLREDLHDLQIPVIYAQLGLLSSDCSKNYCRGQKEYAYWDLVKSMQEKVDLPRSRMIRTEPFSASDDGIHQTTRSQLLIGEEFARALLK